MPREPGRKGQLSERTLPTVTVAVSAVVLSALLLIFRPGPALRAQNTPDPIEKAAADSAFDLTSDGFDFLSREGRAHDFFLLGELHGDNDIPDLLKRLWPVLWASGYRHVAAEMSPWAAEQYLTERGGPQITTLWTSRQAAVIRSPAASRAPISSGAATWRNCSRSTLFENSRA